MSDNIYQAGSYFVNPNDVDDVIQAFTEFGVIIVPITDRFPAANDWHILAVYFIEGYIPIFGQIGLEFNIFVDTFVLEGEAVYVEAPGEDPAMFVWHRPEANSYEQFRHDFAFRN